MNSVEPDEPRWTPTPKGAWVAGQDARAALATLGPRVERLDAHAGELARELLDVIDRLDAAHQRIAALERRLGQQEAAGDRTARELNNHTLDHWREGRGR